MKFSVAAILLAVIASAVAQTSGDIKLSQEYRKKLKSTEEACIEETGADKEAVLAFQMGDFSKVDDKVKCYFKCFLGKLGYYENGVANEEAILKQIGPLFGEEQVKPILAKCNGVKGTDDCDTAFELYHCYNTARA